MWKGERRYVTAAQTTGGLTPPNSVVLSVQHSGTVRYYGGRMTIRLYDLSAPDVFAEQGQPPRVVTEDCRDRKRARLPAPAPVLTVEAGPRGN